MQVAEAVKIVLKSNHPYISIVLDKERIKTLHMEDSLDSIKNSIMNHRNLKLKAEVRIFHHSLSHVLPLMVFVMFNILAGYYIPWQRQFENFPSWAKCQRR